MMNKYSGPERRKSERAKASFLITYSVRKPGEVLMKVGSGELPGVMLDLSEGGMAISTDYDLPVATTILIKATLVNPYLSSEERVRTMEILGDVYYSLALQKKDYRLGIYFTQIAKEDKLAIAKFVKIGLAR